MKAQTNTPTLIIDHRNAESGLTYGELAAELAAADFAPDEPVKVTVLIEINGKIFSQPVTLYLTPPNKAGKREIEAVQKLFVVNYSF